MKLNLPSLSGLKRQVSAGRSTSSVFRPRRDRWMGLITALVWVGVFLVLGEYEALRSKLLQEKQQLEAARRELAVLKFETPEGIKIKSLPPDPVPLPDASEVLLRFRTYLDRAGSLYSLSIGAAMNEGGTEQVFSGIEVPYWNVSITAAYSNLLNALEFLYGLEEGFPFKIEEAVLEPGRLTVNGRLYGNNARRA